MHKVIVIGGGPSGLQAGVFTSKAGEDTLVIDSDESLVYNTSNIKNLIGHDSIGGHELLKKGREKLEQLGGEFKEEKVESLERIDGGFRVTTSEGEHESEYVIIASAGAHDYAELDLDYEPGVEGPYMMEKHIITDDSNKAADGVYAAGLANTWEYQTSVAIGDGAKAAINLLSEIYGEPYEDHDT